jgi:hypothetical protein
MSRVRTLIYFTFQGIKSMGLGRMEMGFVLCIGVPYKINERKSISYLEDLFSSYQIHLLLRCHHLLNSIISST